MKTKYPFQSGQSNLADAKARLNIHDLWIHFGFAGNSRKNPCCSPFRKDSKPSFSVNAAGTLCHDFTTGEAGDQIWFYQRATGLSQKDACRKFIELAGGRIPPARTVCRPPISAVESKPKPAFPAFQKGTADDLKWLAGLRKIGPEGIEFASERGLLWFTTLKDLPAWIITDSARVNAQARRMDGKPWEHIGAKAWTLPGSFASWPIGIHEAQDFPAIALCEGGPDLLAAHYLALWEQATHHKKRDVRCAPVAMMGAAHKIPPEALPLFTGKRVRIFGHDDDNNAGRSAVERWAVQLATVGANVDAFSFKGLVQENGLPVKDLNDSLLADLPSQIHLVSERMLP